MSMLMFRFSTIFYIDPFFEGWYSRIVDEDNNRSFGILFGKIDTGKTLKYPAAYVSILHHSGENAPIENYDAMISDPSRVMVTDFVSIGHVYTRPHSFALLSCIVFFNRLKLKSVRYLHGTCTIYTVARSITIGLILACSSCCCVLANSH